MSTNYPPPPQGPGQPNPPGPPYGPPPGYGGPAQPPQYGQPGQPQPPQNGQPGPPQYGQPGYGPPPQGGYYGPPPGANPYNSPQGVPPPAGYPPRPAAQPVKPKAKLNPALLIGGLVLLAVIVAAILALTGVLSNVEATDYPGATKASLSNQGTTYVNNLYDNKQSSNDNRKVFLTGDTPEAVFKFYRDDLTSKGWAFEGEGTLSDVKANKYTKGDKLFFVIADNGSKNLILDAGTKTFIILLTGNKTN